MVSAHSRDDPLATVSQCSSNEHEPSLASEKLLPRCLCTDLTLLAGDSMDEFGDRPTIGFAIAVGSNQHPHVMTDEDMPPTRQTHSGT